MRFQKISNDDSTFESQSIMVHSSSRSTISFQSVSDDRDDSSDENGFLRKVSDFDAVILETVYKSKFIEFASEAPFRSPRP